MTDALTGTVVRGWVRQAETDAAIRPSSEARPAPEALRLLRRRLSDTIFATLLADEQPPYDLGLALPQAA